MSHISLFPQVVISMAAHQSRGGILLFRLVSNLPRLDILLGFLYWLCHEPFVPIIWKVPVTRNPSHNCLSFVLIFNMTKISTLHITWRWSSHCLAGWRLQHCWYCNMGVFSVLEMVTNQAVRTEKHSTHETFERCSRHLFSSCRCEVERHRRGFAIEIVGWKLDVFSYHHSGSFAVQIGKSWERTIKIMRTRKRRPRLWTPFSDIWIIKTRLSKSLTSQHWHSESQTMISIMWIKHVCLNAKCGGRIGSTLRVNEYNYFSIQIQKVWLSGKLAIY